MSGLELDRSPVSTLDRARSGLGRLAHDTSELIGPGLIALSEGAWITVVYLVFQVAAHEPRPLNVAAFTVAAAIGMTAGTRLGRGGHPNAAVLGAFLVVAGGIGWMLGGPDLGALLRGEPAATLGDHPGGWLMGLAVLRGIVRGRTIDEVDTSAFGFGGPVVALAAAWILGGALEESSTVAFGTEALGPTVVFVVAGPIGLTLSRVAAQARSGGFSWQANRWWLALIAAAALTAGGAAVALSTTGYGLLRSNGSTLFVLAVIAVVALQPAHPRETGPTWRKVASGWLIFGLLAVIVVLLPRPAPPSQQPGDIGGQTGTALPATVQQDGAPLAVLGGALLVGLVVIILRRRGGPLPGAARLEPGDRSVVKEGGGGWRHAWGFRLPSRRRRETPSDAVAAYRAALIALSTDQATRREPAETPSEHSHRLRHDGLAGLDLDLLAADYELVRFGGRQLTASEHTRAIGRWTKLRETVDRLALARAAEIATVVDPQGVAEGAEESRHSRG